MANITYRNGSYRFRVTMGYDHNGKLIQHTMTYKPKATSPTKIRKEVEKAAQEFEDKIKKGQYLDGDVTTFREVLDLWQRDYGNENLDSFTLEGYLRAINEYALPAFGNMAIGRIRAANVQAVITEMKKDGLAIGSIRRNFSAIRAPFKYAFRGEIIESDPCDRVTLPKEKAKSEELHYFTPKQCNDFLDFLRDYPIHALYDEEAEKSEKRSILMWRAFFTLAIYTGCRRGELIALRWSDFDFRQKTVTISRAFAHSSSAGQYLKSPKSQSGFRTISVPQPALDLLKQWKKEEKKLSADLGSLWEGQHAFTVGEDFEENFVFIDQKTGGPIFVDTPSKKFKKIIGFYNERCEKGQELPQIHLHDLRHTAASILITTGADISTVSHRLGHSKTSVTLDIYSHWMKESDRAAADMMEEALKRSAGE